MQKTKKYVKFIRDINMKKFILLLAVAFAMLANVNLKAFTDADGDGWMDINNYTDLLLLASNSSFWTANYELTADIIIPNGVNFPTIGTYVTPFTGNFRGRDPLRNASKFKIYNLHIDRSSDNCVGMFGMNWGTISDVVMCKYYIWGYNHVGGICGLNGGTITGCEMYFSNSDFNPSLIIGNHYIGGMVGSNEGTFTNCKPTYGRLVAYKYAIVYGDSAVGGYLGSSAINYEYTVSGNEVWNVQIGVNTGMCGGFVGINAGRMSHCYVGGDSSYVNAGSATWVGGFAGMNKDTIMQCCSKSRVNGYNCVAGFVASNFGNITSCYSTGSVRGATTTDSTAGFVGVNQPTGSVYYCYSTPIDIIPKLTAGAFMAHCDYGSWNYCVYDDRCQNPYYGYGVGWSTYMMKNSMFPYQSWNFTSLWEFSTENNGYPSFRLVGYYKSNLADNTNNIEIYPNPVRNTSTININKPDKGFTTISVYDINGKKIETLYSGDLNTNDYTMNFNGSDYSTGTYYMVVESKDNKTTKQIVINH